MHQAKSAKHNMTVGIGIDIGAGTSFSLLSTRNEAYKVSVRAPSKSICTVTSTSKSVVKHRPEIVWFVDDVRIRCYRPRLAAIVLLFITIVRRRQQLPDRCSWL